MIELNDRLIDAIAQRVVEMLSQRDLAPAQELVTAAALARRLGVERTWVYDHADELGAIRLGDGPRARLRFDVHRAERALSARTTPASTPPSRNRSSRRQTQPRRRFTPSGVPLLPVRLGPS